MCLLVGYVDGWADENFAVVYFYLIDASVPIFPTVAFSCFEVTLFPKVYQKFGHVLTDKGPFVVKGRIEKDCGTVTALWLGRMKAVGMQGVNQ